MQRTLGYLEARLQAISETLERAREQRVEQAMKIDALHTRMDGLEQSWQRLNSRARGAYAVLFLLVVATATLIGWLVDGWDKFKGWFSG